MQPYNVDINDIAIVPMCVWRRVWHFATFQATDTVLPYMKTMRKIDISSPQKRLKVTFLHQNLQDQMVRRNYLEITCQVGRLKQNILCSHMLRSSRHINQKQAKRGSAVIIHMGACSISMCPFVSFTHTRISQRKLQGNVQGNVDIRDGGDDDCK